MTNKNEDYPTAEPNENQMLSAPLADLSCQKDSTTAFLRAYTKQNASWYQHQAPQAETPHDLLQFPCLFVFPDATWRKASKPLLASPATLPEPGTDEVAASFTSPKQSVFERTAAQQLLHGVSGTRLLCTGTRRG